jgi:hypothetical protein
MTSSPRAATQRFGLQAAAALCIVYPAFTAAQTLEDVVVSASRTEQRSFDAPAAIQSIDRETIEVSGPQVNLSEALIRVPGVTILNRQNYAQDLQLSIRGFGARTAFGIRGVRLIVDGIPASMPDGQGQALKSCGALLRSFMATPRAASFRPSPGRPPTPLRFRFTAIRDPMTRRAVFSKAQAESANTGWLRITGNFKPTATGRIARR